MNSAFCPRSTFCLLFLLVGSLSFGIRVDLAAKRQALKQPVCLIPKGETIDLGDLPKGELRLDWMRRLPNSKPLSLVSIPATHDAGTALGMFGWSRCQVLTIPAQLALGIRGFDIRLRLVGSILEIYHGMEDQKLSFDQVLASFDRFLSAHPHEFLVMRVREETVADRPDRSFEGAFSEHIAAYNSRFYRAKSRTEIPSVGQMRGKILILDNFGKLPESIAYPNSTMSVQDDYDISDMAKKYDEIQSKFHDALGRRDGSVWDVNYTSSCNAVVDQLMNAQAVNEKVLAYVRGKRGNLGLVLMNFPGMDVIHEIIKSNF
jgi:hypothetical protein